MPRMVTKFAPQQEVEILMGDNTDTDWRLGSINKVMALRLYQVHIPGYGYIMKRENEIRVPVEAAGETGA